MATTRETGLLVVGAPDRQPSILFDDLCGFEGGNRLDQLSRVRSIAGGQASIQRRLANAEGLYFEAQLAGPITSLQTISALLETLPRIPKGLRMHDIEQANFDADLDGFLETCGATAALVVLSPAGMVSRSDLRLFQACQRAFDGKVIGVIREAASRTGKPSILAAELSEKLKASVISAPASPPGGPWGVDELWRALEFAIDDLAGISHGPRTMPSQDGTPVAAAPAPIVMNTAEVTALVRQAYDDLDRAKRFDAGDPLGQTASIEIARNTWRLVLKIAQQGSSSAQEACLDIAANRKGIELLELQPIEVINCILQPAARLRALAHFAIPKNELSQLFTDSVGQPCQAEVEIYLIKQAERTHDDTLGETLLTAKNADIASRALLLVGAVQLRTLERLAGSRHTNPVELLRQLVDATSSFEEWATKTSNINGKTGSQIVRQLRERADRASQIILTNTASVILRSLAMLFESAVLDISAWEKERLSAVSSTNLWLSLAPRSEQWTADIRRVLETSIEYSRTTGGSWAHQSASTVNSAKRRAQRSLETWYAFALLGGVGAGLSFLLIDVDPIASVILGPLSLALIIGALNKHHSNRMGLGWASYYQHPPLPGLVSSTNSSNPPANETKTLPDVLRSTHVPKAAKLNPRDRHVV